MSVVRFIADPHFGHKNVIEGLRHMEIEEHDKLIINNWNHVVGKKDITYILGDITMDKPNLLAHYLQQLNGEIRIIGGNHDTPRVCQTLQSFGIPVLGCLEYKGFICTHIPIHPLELRRWEKSGQAYGGNIHGHLHEETINHAAYFNVCCEHTDYTPVTLEWIRNKYQKK